MFGCYLSTALCPFVVTIVCLTSLANSCDCFSAVPSSVGVFANPSSRLRPRLKNSPAPDAEVREASAALRQKPPPSTDTHPPTLAAIARGLLARSQNIPGKPLRLAEDGSTEPWEITFAAGTIAQSAAEEWVRQEGLDLAADDEVVQVVAGRVVAVLVRLDDLEKELLARCCSYRDGLAGKESPDDFMSIGVPEQELVAWQRSSDDPTKRASDSAAAIDAVCLFDELLRYNRARSLLALFLREIEGPGLRRNNVTMPCMDVDFLSENESRILFPSKDEDEVGVNAAVEKVNEETSTHAGDAADELSEVSRLHPITVDAIEEAFRLRAQNSTTSPLRLLALDSEWFEVQYSIHTFAERFLEKHAKARRGEVEWTPEELQTIGGRIVGVLTRLDDLEWEWNHRVTTSPSTKGVAALQWKTAFGLHPGNVEQRCIRTVDEALLKEGDFARARAERMLALFLLNIEAPGLKAGGEKVPGGSFPDFIEDDSQLELMMPTQKKV